MSSLSQRLRMLQVPSTQPVESLDHLSLEELNVEPVAFGQKHLGKQFQDTWEDQEWVSFMINRYQNSTKDAHRRYIKWVELKIESMERAQMVIPRSSQGGGGRAGAKPKPMAKSLATPSPTCSLVGEPEWDMEPEMYASLTMGQIANPQPEEMAAMQERMLNLENALTRVIHHMETQAIQEAGTVQKENM